MRQPKTARAPGEVDPAMDAEFDENKHPRAENGQFGSGGGEGSAKSAPDLHHLGVLRESLSREKGRLKDAKSPKDKAFRESNIALKEKEIAGELKFLKDKHGYEEPDLSDLSDEDLMRELLG